jgi:hypothetical protein
MILNWFKVYNIQDFNDEDLVSKELELDFGVLGIKTILLTKGISYSILYDGIFLSFNLNDKNPFAFDDTVIYVDGNLDLYLGVLSAS